MWNLTQKYSVNICISLKLQAVLSYAPFHIDLAKDIRNDHGFFLCYKKFRYIQKLIGMHAYNQKSCICLAILSLLKHEKLQCMHYPKGRLSLNSLVSFLSLHFGSH